MRTRLPHSCGVSVMLHRHRLPGSTLAAGLILLLTGCAPLGSLMSPYSETFSCKNDDHGQCIHPSQAYEDARAGIASRSDPAVTNDRDMLKDKSGNPPMRGAVNAYGSYRASLYRELQGLIDAPVTPMLKPARTIRTLILPYADPQRPERLYMPRYVFSILDRPEWVVGGSLVASPQNPGASPMFDQSRDPSPTAESPAPATGPLP
jgi:conjugal transfer pilus assembly protein TraV